MSPSKVNSKRVIPGKGLFGIFLWIVCAAGLIYQRVAFAPGELPTWWPWLVTGCLVGMAVGAVVGGMGLAMERGRRYVGLIAVILNLASLAFLLIPR